jgi:hypothetical protein
MLIAVDLPLLTPMADELVSVLATAAPFDRDVKQQK